jgi:hypothetical protein
LFPDFRKNFLPLGIVSLVCKCSDGENVNMMVERDVGVNHKYGIKMGYEKNDFQNTFQMRYMLKTALFSCKVFNVE